MTFAVPLTFRAFLLLLAFFGCVTGSSSNSNSIKDKNRESNRFIRRNLINFDGSTTSEILDDRELQIQFIIGGTEADLNDFPFFASLPVGW